MDRDAQRKHEAADRNDTARDVIARLSSRQEVEAVAANGPSAVVRGWAPHLSAEEIRAAALAYLAEEA